MERVMQFQMQAQPIDQLIPMDEKVERLERARSASMGRISKEVTNIERGKRTWHRLGSRLLARALRATFDRALWETA